MQSATSAHSTDSWLRHPLLGAQHGDATINVAAEDEPLFAPRAPSEPTFKPEDYTSLIYNLHAWSYRVSRQEFLFYSQRRLQQLQLSLGTHTLTAADIAQTQSRVFVHRTPSSSSWRRRSRSNITPATRRGSNHAPSAPITPRQATQQPGAAQQLPPEPPGSGMRRVPSGTLSTGSGGACSSGGIHLHHHVRVRPLEALKHKLASDRRSVGSSGSCPSAADRAAADEALLAVQLPSSLQRNPSNFGLTAHTAAAADAAADAAFHGGRGAAVHSSKAYSGISWLGLPMLPATHRFMLIWAVLMLAIDLVYTAILLPVVAAFEFNSPGEPLYWVSVTFGLLYVLDMLVTLHRGVVVKYLDTYIYVDLPSDVMRLYITHGQFWPDLVVSASAPLQLLSRLLPDEQRKSRHFTAYVNVLVLLRGLRLIRLLLLQREVVLGKLGLRYLKKRRVWYVYSCVYILAVLLNWLACIMLFIARSSNDPHRSWLATVKGRDLTQASPGRQYIAALYFMMVTTTTVGYGDVSGGTAVEQLAIVGAVLTGVCFIAYSIKNLMDVMMETAMQDENAQRVGLLKERAHMLRLWATWQDLPKGLMERIIDYNSGPWLTHTVLKRSWEGVLYDLPPDLKGEMLMVTLVDRHRELAPVGARLLRGLPTSAARCFLALLEPRPLAPGHMLCWAGEPAAEIWLLQEGELVTLCGILPDGPLTSTPGLLVAMDLHGWVQQQQQQQGEDVQQGQQLPGAAPPSGAYEAAAGQPSRGSNHGGSGSSSGAGGGGSGQWLYTSSLQSTGASFLWALPLKRLALALVCMPELGRHLIEELDSQ